MKRQKKYTINKDDDREVVILEKYGYKNNELKKGIYCTTIKGNTTMENKYEKVIPHTRYEIKDGELYILKENDNKVIEENNNILMKLLKL